MSKSQDFGAFSCFHIDQIVFETLRLPERDQSCCLQKSDSFIKFVQEISRNLSTCKSRSELSKEFHCKFGFEFCRRSPVGLKLYASMIGRRLLCMTNSTKSLWFGMQILQQQLMQSWKEIFKIIENLLFPTYFASVPNPFMMSKLPLGMKKVKSFSIIS